VLLCLLQQLQQLLGELGSHLSFPPSLAQSLQRPYVQSHGVLLFRRAEIERKLQLCTLLKSAAA
jgi:hypothetical protein